MIVNIYTYTTAKAPINRIVGYAYVLECEINGTPRTAEKIGHFEDISRNLAEIKCLMAALKQLNRPCTLEIYATSNFTANVINGYLHKWEASGWKNSRGEDVDEIYKELNTLLKPHKVHGQTGHTSYSDWLYRESHKEKTLCHNSLRNMGSSSHTRP